MRLVPSRGLWGRSCHSRNLLALWFDLCTLSLMSVKSWIFLLKNQLDSNETAVFCKLTYRQDLKKCRNCTFKVIFLCQKSMQYARDHFLLNFFFWKNSVNFWHRKLTLKVQFRHFLMDHHRIILKQFPLSMSILGQKSWILGPTIFKIPQPNWHYLISTLLHCFVFLAFQRKCRPVHFGYVWPSCA